MPHIEVNGKTIETDKHGYLSDINDWSMDVARHIAKLENLEMDEIRWDVVHGLRKIYLETGHIPLLKMVAKTLREKHGKEHSKPMYLYQLFPKGPAKQACKIAGLPKPTGCI